MSHPFFPAPMALSSRQKAVLAPSMFTKMVLTTSMLGLTSWRGYSTSVPPVVQRGWSAMKARPFLHLFSFGAVHVTMAWALVPPIYWFFRTTNSANSLLGGPQTGWILSRPIPDWAPTKLLGLTETQQKEGANVEDLLEVQAKRMVNFLWKFGVGAYGSAKSMSSQGKQVMEQLQTSAKQLEDGDTESATRGLAKSAMDFLKKSKNPPKKHEAEDEMVKKASKDSWWGATAKKHANEVKFGQIRDAVAAYVVVKTLLPFRVPLSLFLTPKFARLFNRVFASART